LDVAQNFRDQRWVVDAGNDPKFPTALGAGLDIDLKHPFQALCPVHRGGWLVAVHLAAGTARHDAGAVFEVGRKYTRNGFAASLTPCGRTVQLPSPALWKRVRLSRGLGTNATRRAMAAPAHPCARGIQYILYIKSSGSSTTWVDPSRNGCL
jgi:hypothetical protein